MFNYSFLLLYSPILWLAQNEQYLPCTVEYFENYTHREIIDGRYWRVSNQKLTDPSEILPYFHGQNPESVPMYVIITPNIDEKNPVDAMKYPHNHSIVATYFTLYPYNRGKQILDTVWDNHVGDIEHAHIFFKNAIPTKIIASYHSWNTTKTWGDSSIEMNGTHPVLYSAKGSHGLWFSVGKHEYMPGLYDETSKGIMWYNDMVLILPQEWNSTFWLSELWRWGDPHTEFSKDNCYKIFGEELCRFDDGPIGFLGKDLIKDVIQKLVEEKIVCKDCVWNAGIFN